MELLAFAVLAFFAMWMPRFLGKYHGLGNVFGLILMLLTILNIAQDPAGPQLSWFGTVLLAGDVVVILPVMLITILLLQAVRNK